MTTQAVSMSEEPRNLLEVPLSVATSETHISTLFFTTDRVYKMLKPVVNGFLDHRDSAIRCEAAQREYELNKRIAPDVYLGTADIIENGALADRMIVMKRLPSQCSVTAMLRQGRLTSEHVRSIARAVATFHASIDPIYPSGKAAEVHRTRWTSNTTEMKPFVGTVLDTADTERITELFSAWLESHGDLLDQRVTDGFMRDGHGDLLADDIFCLDDGPEILDCLAFRDDLRMVDVLDDIAFLAMDLHRLAGPIWAQQLLKFYGEFSGERHPGSLAHYYLAYRAHVRCKIACLRVEAGDLHHAAIARMYHRLCLDQLERARLRLILVGGGPGTGKTTLANALGQQFGCAVLSTDEIRKDLARVERTEHYLAKPDLGIYEPEHTKRTYDELIRQSGLLLRNGETVVLDASWTDESHREMARNLASARGAEMISLECILPSGIAKERIVRRSADPMSTSDATPEIVDHLAREHDPWIDAIAIDCNQTFRSVEGEALQAIRAFGRHATATTTRLEGRSFWGVAVSQERIPPDRINA